MKVSELLKIVDGIVSLKDAFEDDLVGITIGSEENDVDGIIVAHELDKQLLDYCLDLNINTVLSKLKYIGASIINNPLKKKSI